MFSSHLPRQLVQMYMKGYEILDTSVSVTNGVGVHAREDAAWWPPEKCLHPSREALYEAAALRKRGRKTSRMIWETGESK